MEVMNIGWSSFLKSWISTCKSEWIDGHEEQIVDILNWLIPPCLQFISQFCNQLIYPSEVDLVKTCINIIQITLDEVFKSGINKEEEIKNIPAWIQGTLIHGCILGLGSTLDTSSKQKFDEFCKLLWKGQSQNYPYPSGLEKVEVSLPHEGTIFDYQFIYKQRGVWKLYHDLLKSEKVIETPYRYELSVPTVENLRISHILHNFIKYNKPVILVGASSTGKSFLLEDIMINKLNKKTHEASLLNFNFHYSPYQVQSFVLSKLNKRKSGVYSPPRNKNFVIFIDNLHLNTISPYGIVKCLELLRQLLDHKVWYDFHSSEELTLENLNFVTTVGLYGGAHKKICKRFLRHFHTIALSEFTDETISRIYSTCLFYTWKKAGFPSDTNIIVNHIVDGTLNVFKDIRNQCKPTINRCYYIFDLKTFSKVIQVCAILKKETFDANKKIYVKLWSHEMLRVYGDRLSMLEFSWLQSKIKTVITDIFKENLEEIFDSENKDKLHQIIFGTINDRENLPRCKRYEEILDRKHLVDILSDYLLKYNSENCIKLDLIFFTYALERLMQISRILSLTFGNALLLGISGSGRKSLTKLTAFINKQKLFQPIITQCYTIKMWTEEIKLIVKEAGAKEKQCVFLVTEEQLITESFLDIVQQLLQKGEIPGLFNMEEKQEILEMARLSAQGGNKNVDISSSAVFLYFNRKCKENLHLVICLNPTKNIFRERILKYPSLMDCHVIYWHDWPDESLQAVVNTWIENLNIQENTQRNFTDIAVYVHRDFQRITKQLSSNNQNGIPTTRFIHLVKLFKELFLKKHSEIHQKKQRYLQALSKLSFAASQISKMQTALAQYQPQLEEMTQKAIIMTEQIALETIEVEKASALVRKDEKIASEQAIVAQQLKSECESELAQAIPILEDAISALNTLKPSDITLVKSMKNPPDAIKLVMAAVCVIKDVKPDRIPDPSTGRKTIDYWGPSKRILGDMNFLQTLKDFDKDHIKPEIMVKIRKEYLPHKDFKPHVVAKASSAAEGLCKWIIAMDMYDKVAKEVAPKKEKLVKAEKEYAATMAILNQKKDEVKRIEQKLADLKDMLEDARKKQTKLRLEVEFCNRKLLSAQKLIGSLSGEKIRWTVSVKNLENQENLVPGNILLSCSIICYLGFLDWKMRNEISSQWHHYVLESELPCSNNFNIIKSLATETDTDRWLENGLPNDNFFFENIIILNFSKLFSVIVDPEYQATDWIMKTEKYNSLTVTTFQYKDFLEKIEECVILGKPILVQKIKENIPASMDDLMSKRIYQKNEEEYINLNNKYVKYHKDFRLYLVSNLESPKFSPENSEKITLINFSLSTKGLEDKLLKIITEIEKPQLKKMKKELFYKRCKNIAEISDLENKILKTLCESDADILEDEASIKILDQSKDLARVARNKQMETKQIEHSIEEFSGKYLAISAYCANMYHCLVQLKHIKRIYQFSLERFADIYSKCILYAERSRDFDKKCKNIMNYFPYLLFRKVENSLFQNDKIIFLFLLATSILIFNKELTQMELAYFIDTYENIQVSDKPPPAGISSKTWNKLLKLQSLEGHDDIMNSFLCDAESWKVYFESTFNVFKGSTPVSTTKFQKLNLIKILKPSALYEAMGHFIEQILGGQFLHYVPYNINNTFNESYSISPILFFTIPGSDVYEKIKRLARMKQVLHKFNHYSFGHEGIRIADQLIVKAQKEGSWLLVQNCHFEPQWFSEVEKKLIDVDYEDTHENFRLWLTADATTNISEEFLQSCIKVIDEPPDGVTRNLERIFKSAPICDTEFYKNCPGKQDIFTRLLYGLVFFHCVIQERWKFGRLGWNSPYFFDESDLHISIRQLILVLNEDFFSHNNFDKLIFMIGKCSYSTYLNNEFDKILLMNLLRDFVNPKVTNSNYTFCNIREYCLPKKCDYQNYLDSISKLPSNDDRDIYGMNEASHMYLKMRQNELVLQTLGNITGKSYSKVLSENDFSLLTKINDVLHSLPDVIENASKNYVIAREISLYNILLEEIQSSLLWLRQSLNGDVVLSQQNEDMLKSIMNHRVPDFWMKQTLSSETHLGHFFKSLKEKIEFFRNFKDSENTFYLGAFIYPKSLICKAKLDSANTFQIPIEKFTFTHLIGCDNSVINVSGIFLRDLYLFGAIWDNENDKLIETCSSIYNKLPLVHLKPGEFEDLPPEIYRCPLYQNSNFTELISHINLPAKEPSYWLKRCTRLLCQVNSEFNLEL